MLDDIISLRLETYVVVTYSREYVNVFEQHFCQQVLPHHVCSLHVSEGRTQSILVHHTEIKTFIIFHNYNLCINK